MAAASRPQTLKALVVATRQPEALGALIAAADRPRAPRSPVTAASQPKGPKAPLVGTGQPRAPLQPPYGEAAASARGGVKAEKAPKAAPTRGSPYTSSAAPSPAAAALPPRSLAQPLAKSRPHPTQLLGGATPKLPLRPTHVAAALPPKAAPIAKLTPTLLPKVTQGQPGSPVKAVPHKRAPKAAAPGPSQQGHLGALAGLPRQTPPAPITAGPRKGSRLSRPGSGVNRRLLGRPYFSSDGSHTVVLRPQVQAGCPARYKQPARGGQWRASIEPSLKIRAPQHTLLGFWNLLYQQPLLNYSLKYCRLSRRVRKILKNKYRYSKYFFAIAPAKRVLFTLHLWRYALKFHTEPALGLRLQGLIKSFGQAPSDGLFWTLFYVQQRLALKRLLGR